MTEDLTQVSGSEIIKFNERFPKACKEIPLDKQNIKQLKVNMNKVKELSNKTVGNFGLRKSRSNENLNIAA